MSARLLLLLLLLECPSAPAAAAATPPPVLLGAPSHPCLPSLLAADFLSVPALGARACCRYSGGDWHADEYETADEYARRIWQEMQVQGVGGAVWCWYGGVWSGVVGLKACVHMQGGSCFRRRPPARPPAGAPPGTGGRAARGLHQAAAGGGSAARGVPAARRGGQPAHTGGAAQAGRGVARGGGRGGPFGGLGGCVGMPGMALACLPTTRAPAPQGNAGAKRAAYEAHWQFFASKHPGAARPNLPGTAERAVCRPHAAELLLTALLLGLLSIPCAEATIQYADVPWILPAEAPKQEELQRVVLYGAAHGWQGACGLGGGSLPRRAPRLQRGFCPSRATPRRRHHPRGAAQAAAHRAHTLAPGWVPQWGRQKRGQAGQERRLCLRRAVRRSAACTRSQPALSPLLFLPPFCPADKFNAKFGRRLAPGDADRVLARVLALSQLLNAISATIQA